MDEELRPMDGENEDNGLIELVDEDGNSETFELLASFDMDGKQYLAVADTEEEEEDPAEQLIRRSRYRSLSADEEAELQSLIGKRHEIEIKYHLTNADVKGFDDIRKEIQRETEEALKPEECAYVPSCVAPRTDDDRGMIIRWI